MNGMTLEKISGIRSALSLALILFCANALSAEDVWKTDEVNADWQTECGSCHYAFPPALLTQGNWRMLMSELDTHFGVNAVMDNKTRDEITAFLVRNSGTSGWRSAESLRVTQTGWFVKNHPGGIKMLQAGRIQSLTDCVSCHK